ncbi:Rv3235 family protein [Arthrobacter sp. RCC_34]|uniref:Rv3235 family protein n=1 Tax=Arthrobacter sp. RCC_34 TaxID=3239230 RepID=UPI003523ADB8
MSAPHPGLSSDDHETVTLRTITPPRPAPPPVPASFDEARRLSQLKGQVQRLVQAVMEALNGSRPLQQLSRWMEPELFASLQLRRALVQESQEHFGRGRPSPYADAHVQSVHAQCPTSQIVEATAVVRCRKRTRAVAIRMEARRTSWIVTALEIG